MPVVSLRITDAEDEILKTRAEEAGFTKSDLLRQALDAYFREKPKQPQRGVRRVFPQKEDQCPHPWSKRMNLPAGVMCDECGSWI